jgi:hypothetical protein
VVQYVKNKETIHAYLVSIYIGSIQATFALTLCKLVHLYLLCFVLASITKKGEIERELDLHLVPNLFWWLNCPTQIFGLTSLF